ncbi:hypothetical protein DNTS_026743 [Danionella cerebrum]|uniref:SPRY-associated domain-containing protein n=1 Tax=Danionella cerebrum TaxID=2873325 RepID=A0A553RE11_9TELE|nr:hypothetical protein DNTS_026743 [Danionella translucida]
MELRAVFLNGADELRADALGFLHGQRCYRTHRESRLEQIRSSVSEKNTEFFRNALQLLIFCSDSPYAFKHKPESDLKQERTGLNRFSSDPPPKQIPEITHTALIRAAEDLQQLLMPRADHLLQSSSGFDHDPTETVSTGNRHWILEEIQTHSTEELILSLRNTGFCHFPSRVSRQEQHDELLTFSFSKLEHFLIFKPDAASPATREQRGAEVNTALTQMLPRFLYLYGNSSPPPIELLSLGNIYSSFQPRITLDPNTANQYLLLSEGNRAAECSSKPQPYPDHPERFDYYPQVLGRESLGGRSYWEELEECLYQYHIRASGGRDGVMSVGFDVILSPGVCSGTELPGASSGSRIGVYVDRGAGILSFYSVSHTMSLIHSIRTSFTEPLYPGFWLGRSSRVKICDLKVEAPDPERTRDQQSLFSRTQEQHKIALAKNMIIAERMEKLKMSRAQAAGAAQSPAGPGDTGNKSPSSEGTLFDQELFWRIVKVVSILRILQKQLEETQRSVRQRIQERQKELEELKEGIEAHKKNWIQVEDDRYVEFVLISQIEGLSEGGPDAVDEAHCVRDAVERENSCSSIHIDSYSRAAGGSGEFSLFLIKHEQETFRRPPQTPGLRIKSKPTLITFSLPPDALI